MERTERKQLVEKGKGKGSITGRMNEKNKKTK